MNVNLNFFKIIFKEKISLKYFNDKILKMSTKSIKNLTIISKLSLISASNFSSFSLSVEQIFPIILQSKHFSYFTRMALKILINLSCDSTWASKPPSLNIAMNLLRHFSSKTLIIPHDSCSHCFMYEWTSLHSKKKLNCFFFYKVEKLLKTLFS